jgi:hypothetical protein
VLACLLDALGAGFSEEEALIGFDTVDTNVNGKIEFREFMKWWDEQP